MTIKLVAILILIVCSFLTINILLLFVLIAGRRNTNIVYIVAITPLLVLIIPIDRCEGINVLNAYKKPHRVLEF